MHSKYAPSASERWLNCAMSLQYPDDGSTNDAAEKGTRLHSASSDLRQNAEALALIADSLSDLYDVSDDDLSNVMASYQQYTDKLIERHDYNIIEQRVATRIRIAGTNRYERIYGTVDCAAWSDFDELEIVDLKTGHWPVSVIEKSQLMLYALMVYDTFKPDVAAIKVTIVQPSLDGNPVRSYEFGVERLERFRAEVETQLGVIKEYPDECNPGDWCQWCPGIKSGKCSAHQGAIQEIASDADKVTMLEPQRIVEILDAEKNVNKTIKVVKDLAIDYILKGGQLGHWNLTGKRGTRTWVKDDKNIAAALRRRGVKDVWVKRLVSPAEAEKLGVDKEWVEQVTESPAKSGYNLKSNKKQQELAAKMLAGLEE